MQWIAKDIIMTVRYDDSLPCFVRQLVNIFGVDLIQRTVIVRDAGGRLSAVLPERITSERLNDAIHKVSTELENYARPDRLIADIESPGASSLIKEATGVSPITINGQKIRIIDRRIVGADWLRPPVNSSEGIPRIVFASLKGGVGRSTALCVVAAHLSRKGLRVLAVDFDLEAPGLGSMLLKESELPKFGTLDYLVENGLSGVDSKFIADLSGGSFLGSGGGRVTVVPAIGKSTADNPANTLGKIARAYLEDIKPDGTNSSVSEQLREMIQTFESTGAYDIILVDARAGLHETTAAAILALGGDTLLFGMDQPQTFIGYRLLLAHLAQFPINSNDDWRERLYFVHAKASDLLVKRVAAEERFIELYKIISPSRAQISAANQQLTADDFKLDWDENADDLEEDESFTPPTILRFLEDLRYHDFDPLLKQSLLTSEIYSVTYKSLLDYIDAIVENSTADSR